MKKLFLLSLLIVTVLSCGKEEPTIDGTDQFSFNSSLEAVVESVPSLKRNTLRQAVDLLYKHNTNAVGDRWIQLRKDLNGKTAEQIFVQAEQVAKAKGLNWSRNKTATVAELQENNPSNTSAEDSVTVEVKKPLLPNAEKVQLFVKVTDKALVAFPTVLGKNDELLRFGKEVPALVEVFNAAGEVIYSRRDVMETYRDSDENFGGDGLIVPFSRLNAKKINSTELKMSVRLLDPVKFLKASKSAKVSQDLVYVPPVVEPSEPKDTVMAVVQENKPEETSLAQVISTKIVNRFLTNYKRKNMSGAYALTKNPKWNSYQAFIGSGDELSQSKSIAVSKVSFVENVDENTTKVNANILADQNNIKNKLTMQYTLKRMGEKWFIADAKLISKKQDSTDENGIQEGAGEESEG